MQIVTLQFVIHTDDLAAVEADAKTIGVLLGEHGKVQVRSRNQGAKEIKLPVAGDIADAAAELATRAGELQAKQEADAKERARIHAEKLARAEQRRKEAEAKAKAEATEKAKAEKAKARAEKAAKTEEPQAEKPAEG